MMRSFLVAFVTLALVFPALAYEPGEVLEDPALEERARALSAELRCMVCQNQSIDESNAPLAKDLRILVRDRLVAGDTDTQVIDYVVARYGEYVLLRPRVAPHTYVLWFGPFIILLLAGALSLRYVVRKRSAEAGGEDTSLSTDEQTRINQLMNDGRQN